MIFLAVLGYGVVGSGVVELINKNSSIIKERTGREVVVKKVLDIRDFPNDSFKDIITKNADDIFNDDSIQVVAETIGGVGVAYEFTKRALGLGKHVVTSNKELVATHGPELLSLAAKNNVNYLFEASVGGGIPIIRPMNRCLAANEITQITGILNGTTNYILTQMKKTGADFKDALKAAQTNGYAEANPTADIEGHDTCRKIAILSSIAFNQFVDYNKISTEGITNISLTDLRYAEDMGAVIKLVAISKKENSSVFIRVSPAILDKSHSLANVEDVFNAILIRGDAVGDAMFYGRGAGKLPTASAIVADVIEIVNGDGGNNKIQWNIKDYDNIINIENSFVKYFVRLKVRDIEKAKQDIKGSFGDVKWIVSKTASSDGEIAFETPKRSQKEFDTLLNKIVGQGAITHCLSKIRYLEE